MKHVEIKIKVKEATGKSKEEHKTFFIIEPSAEVLMSAFCAMEFNNVPYMKPGQVITDACWDKAKNEGVDITDIKTDNPILYLSICNQAGTLIEVLEGEIKKN